MNALAKIVAEKIQAIAACNDSDQLIEMLRRCTDDLLGNVAEMAAIVRRLDELGVAVAIENSFLPYIRLIAHGQLSADCFSTCLGDPQLLEQAMRLPMPLQDKIAANEPFKVMESGGAHRMVRPLDMTARERRQVFNGKRLRTDAEQIGWLREQFEKDRSRAPSPSEGAVSLDRKRRGITISAPTFISASQMADYLATLNR